MASKTALHVACIQILGSLDGQEVMNDLYYQYAAQPTHADLVELTASIADVVVENAFAALPTSWVGRYVFGFDMTVPDGANAVDDSILGTVGTLTGTPLPNNVSFAVARKNGLRGRSGNGRIFWMGLATSIMADENFVTSDYATTLIGVMETFDLAASGLDATPVILSFQNDGVHSDEATIYPIASWSAQSLCVCSRRRRLPGRGV